MRETKEIRDSVVLVGLNSPVLKKEASSFFHAMKMATTIAANKLMYC